MMVWPPCLPPSKGLYKGFLPSAYREMLYSSLRFGLYAPTVSSAQFEIYRTVLAIHCVTS